jgi:threonine synthase
MNLEFFKQRVGKTPLIRAKSLERELDISRIYLKLEGNNPSGHREDRLAYLIIRDALSRKKRTICMGTYGTVGGSLSYLSQFYDVKCIFYVPKLKRISRKDLFEAENSVIVEYGKTYEDCVKESRRIASKRGWYNANPGLANNMMNMYAFSSIAEEMHDQLCEPIHTVFCQTSNGSSISGLHMGLKQLWLKEKINTLPNIWAVCTTHGNAILESFARRKKSIVNLDPSQVQETKYNRNMVKWNPFNGQDALNAVADTNGKVVGVDDDELIEYNKSFRKLEKFCKITIPNSYPISAFIKAARDGELTSGNHILILNDGVADLSIRTLSKEKLGMTYKEFVEKLDQWLIQFSDPLEEIEDAVDDAFENGYVVCAYHRGELVGICIVSTSRYDTFFPTYHLSYIATKKDIKGQGIATLLIQKVIELTKGDFSLHVETDNKRAIKLYEKMGLTRKYYRMFYQGGVPRNGD